MEPDFGILPYLLIVMSALLICHAASAQPWRTLSLLGVMAMVIALGLSIAYGSETIGTNKTLFLVQVTCFVIYLFASIFVVLQMVWTVLVSKLQSR